MISAVRQCYFDNSLFKHIEFIVREGEHIKQYIFLGQPIVFALEAIIWSFHLFLFSSQFCALTWEEALAGN